MHNKGLSRTSPKNGTWRISTVCCTVCTVGTRSCRTTGKSTTLSMNWNCGASSKRNCLNLTLHGHKDVHRRTAPESRRPPRPAAPHPTPPLPPRPSHRPSHLPFLDKEAQPCQGPTGHVALTLGTAPPTDRQLSPRPRPSEKTVSLTRQLWCRSRAPDKEYC